MYPPTVTAARAVETYPATNRNIAKKAMLFKPSLPFMFPPYIEEQKKSNGELQ
jgi:hypothetical protein